LETRLTPRALFLTPEAPYPAAGGGTIRSASVLEYLASRYVVDVIVFREPGASDPARSIPRHLPGEVLVLDLPYHSKAPLARLTRNMGRLLRGTPPLNDRFAGFASAISGFLRGRRYDLAVIEHFWCAPYWQEIAPQSSIVVLDMHNLESVLLGRSAETASWPAACAFRRFSEASRRLERRWLPRFSLLLAASGQDAERIRSIAPDSRVSVYPNALPLAPAPIVPEEHVIAFSGNLAYHPNVDAVRYFQGRIWPMLRRRWPGLVWRLIGKHPEAVSRYIRGDPRIQVSGPLDNAVEALAASQVAVVPLRAASGTRVKILEAWAAVRPVVSTTLGAEGLPARDGEHLLLADTPERFFEAVSSLLASAELRTCLGRAGRRLYEEEFTWQSAWSRLAEAGI
jgi:glycosyltransferase involved in cell wall biosynthesis